MKAYNLTFSDGKRCRYIDPDGDGEWPDNFGNRPGYLVSMERVIPPIPDKLPWKRDGDCWRLASFELRKLGSGMFRVEWPSGSAEGGKDEVSAAVRENWEKGC